MSDGTAALAPGLHLVATPIGNARDITLRALDVLAAADVLAAEDTRSLRRLMDIHGLALGGRPLVAYHDHNGAAQRPRLLAWLGEGRAVAYAPEAGTPLIADPGFALARAAAEAGHAVTCVPGASAALAALTVAGLPSDRFFFTGFLPAASAARRKALADLAKVPGTVILFESPRRVQELLADMVQAFGADRGAAVCRELTKRFEEVTRGTVSELAEAFGERSVKGEVVVLVEEAAEVPPGATEIAAALRSARRRGSLKDAVAEVSAGYGLPRREVYRTALSLEDER